jgi:hypothetical protein
MTDQVQKRIHNAVNGNSGSGFAEKDAEKSIALTYRPKNQTQEDKVKKPEPAKSRMKKRTVTKKVIRNAFRATLERTPGMTYKHRACDCVLDPEKIVFAMNLAGDKSNVIASAPDSTTMVVIEPRWCNDCTKKRELEIRKCYEKLAANEAYWDLVNHETKVARSRRNGNCQGRIEALAMPLSENPVGSQEYANDMIRMFGRLSTVSESERLKNEGVSARDIALYEMSEQHRAVNEGITEGRRMQATKEKEALECDDEIERKMMLEFATGCD